VTQEQLDPFLLKYGRDLSLPIWVSQDRKLVYFPHLRDELDWRVAKEIADNYHTPKAVSLFALLRDFPKYPSYWRDSDRKASFWDAMEPVYASP
jgi:hypothetical protein